MMKALQDIKKPRHRVQTMIQYAHDTGFPVDVFLSEVGVLMTEHDRQREKKIEQKELVKFRDEEIETLKNKVQPICIHVAPVL